MASNNITLETKGIDALLKALKGKLPTVKVGILGDKNTRRGDEGNATIGSYHEFGTDKLPMRSFLRVPISDNLESYMENAGAFNKDTLAQVMKDGSLVPWLDKMGAVGVQIVSDAFDTGGFGKWKTSNMKEKKVQQTLVETQQLRNSITWEVK